MLKLNLSAEVQFTVMEIHFCGEFRLIYSCHWTDLRNKIVYCIIWWFLYYGIWIHSNSRFQIQFSRAFKCLMNFHRIHSHNRHTMKLVLFYSNGMIISWTEWISWLSMLITLAKTLFLQHFSVKCQRNQIASLENNKKIHEKYRAVQRSAVYFHSNIYILNDMWNVCGFLFTRTHFFSIHLPLVFDDWHKFTHINCSIYRLCEQSKQIAGGRVYARVRFYAYFASCALQYELPMRNGFDSRKQHRR